MTPSVSVVVPNYNHAPFLARRLDTILAQTHQDFELIILDDASTDGSREVIERYTGDPRVRFLPAERNSGSAFVQWNRGVAAASSEWVWIAESDDYADSRFLATLLHQIGNHPSTVLAYCQSWRVDEHGKALGTMADVWDARLASVRWGDDFVNSGPAECAEYLIWKNTIPNASAVLFRRSAYLKSGGAPETMRLCGDWLTWSRVLQHGTIAYTADPLNYFRQHGTSIRAGTAWLKHLREQWMTQSSIIAWCEVSAETERELARETVRLMFDQVLPAPRGTRLRLLQQCLRDSAPLLRRSPWETTQAVVARAIGRTARRVSPRATT